MDIMYSLRNTYFQYIKTQSILLKWHLNDLLDNLSYEAVLDIGGSLGLAKKFCIKSEVKTVFSLDPDRTFIESFLECSDDSRFNIIEENIDIVNLTKFKYDTAFFLLNLPWITEPLTAIEKVAFNEPNYIVTASQHTAKDKSPRKKFINYLL